MFELGVIYEEGLGVPQDLEKAREWYEKAAEGDNAAAKGHLQKLPNRPSTSSSSLGSKIP
jgi:TPR repeat protein